MKKIPSILTSAILATGMASAATTIVVPTSITLANDAGNWTGNGGTNRTIQNGAANWFNGTGLSDASIVETGDPVPSVFPTHAYGNESRIRSGAPMSPLPQLTIALGAGYDLSALVLWNHGEGATTGTESDRGFSTLTISFSTDGTTFTNPENLSFAKGPQGAAPIAAQVVDFSAPFVGATHVRFSDIQTFAGTPASGTHLQNIAELRFVAIPEPSSAALLGLGVLGLFARRRR